MLKKIYLVLLAIAFVVSGIFSFYCYSWLTSIGKPEIAAQNYQFYSSINWTLIWVTFLILLAFANILLWQAKMRLFFWTSFIYFAVFITLHTFWLEQSFLAFSNSNGLSESSFSTSPVLGIVVCFVVAIAVFFNQFIMMRIKDKVIGDNEDKELLTEEVN